MLNEMKKGLFLIYSLSKRRARNEASVIHSVSTLESGLIETGFGRRQRDAW